jgi:hypothetical protein
VRPDQAGCERDYYRFDWPDLDPNLLDGAFAHMEGAAAQIINVLGQTHTLPEGDEFETLIGFVAMLAIRSPAMRALYEQNMEHLQKRKLQMLLGNRQLFEQFVEDCHREGKELPADFSYERMRAFVEDDDAYGVLIPREWFVQMIAQRWPDMTKLFMGRNWSLLYAAPDDAQLICSDMPVSITPTTPDFQPRFLGFGLPQTELTVPLSRSMAMCGNYEAPSIAAPMPRAYVRNINQRTIAFATRFLYSADETILV